MSHNWQYYVSERRGCPLFVQHLMSSVGVVGGCIVRGGYLAEELNFPGSFAEGDCQVTKTAHKLGYQLVFLQKIL